LVRDAQTPGELHRLQTDSKRTFEGLKLAYIGLYEELGAAIATRIKELGG